MRLLRRLGVLLGLLMIPALLAVAGQALANRPGPPDVPAGRTVTVPSTSRPQLTDPTTSGTESPGPTQGTVTQDAPTTSSPQGNGTEASRQPTPRSTPPDPRPRVTRSTAPSHRTVTRAPAPVQTDPGDDDDDDDNDGRDDEDDDDD